MAITERDLRILEWVFRFATVEQIGRRFELKPPRVYRRLCRWREAGLAEHRRPYRELAGAVWVTPRGARALGLGEVRAPSLELASYRHELTVAELAVALERRGARVLSEREMRRAEREGERRTASRIVAVTVWAPYARRSRASRAASSLRCEGERVSTTSRCWLIGERRPSLPSAIRSASVARTRSARFPSSRP